MISTVGWICHFLSLVEEPQSKCQHHPESIIDNIFLKQYNGLIKEFLWNGKKARIGLRKLTALRDCGGLALPDLELYNLAFEMHKLSRHWKDEDADVGWIKIEKKIAAPFNIIQVLWQKPTNSLQQNPILQPSQWAWAQAHKRLGTSPRNRFILLCGIIH